MRKLQADTQAVEALRQLYRAYVSLLETGRDRIVAFGGTCDPVDVMEAGSPPLRAARAVLARSASPAIPAQEEG